MTELNFRFNKVTHRDEVIGAIVLPNVINGRYIEYNVMPLDLVNYDYGGTTVKLIRVDNPSEMIIVDWSKRINNIEIEAIYEDTYELLIRVKY